MRATWQIGMSSTSHTADPSSNPGEGDGATKINRSFLDLHLVFSTKECADGKGNTGDGLNSGGIGGPVICLGGRCDDVVRSY